MTQKKFEKLVREGIKSIPKRFLKKLDNVDVVIEQEPNAWQLKKLRARKSSIIFGLYEGVPQTKRGNYAQALPDKITIFKKSIEETAKSVDEIKQMVKDTVWHEIAHHFGMSETEVRRAERQRKRVNPSL